MPLCEVGRYIDLVGFELASHHTGMRTVVPQLRVVELGLYLVALVGSVEGMDTLAIVGVGTGLVDASGRL